MIELLKKIHLFETLLEPELAKIGKICGPRQSPGTRSSSRKGTTATGAISS